MYVCARVCACVHECMHVCVYLLMVIGHVMNTGVRSLVWFRVFCAEAWFYDCTYFKSDITKNRLWSSGLDNPEYRYKL